MQETFAGCRVTVMGLGTFGAGIEAARFLSRREATVTVTDLRPPEELVDSIAALADLPGLQFHLGRHDEDDFTRADLIVASPAVKPGNRYLALARQAGIPVTSELRLFWERCPARIVGVTGSNGKSTTATLIHRILQADRRRAWLGGNIGRSLLPDLADVRPEDWVVLELSSFQLADLDSQRLSPHVAVITNLTPNHLDWHGSFEEYVHAKQSIVRWQKRGDIVVRLAGSREADWPTKATSWWFGWGYQQQSAAYMADDRSALIIRQDCARIELENCAGLPSSHARFNAVTATAAALSLEVPPRVIRIALESFSGLPHRLQHVRDWRGRRFINDSASTTPESTCCAVAAFPERRLLLICGGSEKGSELASLAGSICGFVRRAYMIGDVAARLAQTARHFQESRRAEGHACLLENVTVYDDLDTAFERAVEDSRPGDVILFSPGFASGTMFRHFASRGELFSALVGTLPGDNSGESSDNTF